MVSKPLLWLVGFTLLHIVTGLAADDRVAEPAEKKSAPLYDSRPGHPWDQVARFFTFAGSRRGKFSSTRTLFVPPWDEYVPFVHDEAFAASGGSRLDAVEKLPGANGTAICACSVDLYLRDLWPAFDGLHRAT